jgi:hypothetical protein
MSHGNQLGRPLAVIAGVALLAACSPKDSGEPTVDPEPAVNSQLKIQQIRREEARAAAQVEMKARSQAIDGGGLGGSGNVGPTPVPPPETPTRTIIGRLEAAAPDRVVIRDGDGVAHWFETDPNIRVSQDGEPARLSDLPRGTEVRASYVLAGKKKLVTDVEVLGPHA